MRKYLTPSIIAWLVVLILIGNLGSGPALAIEGEIPEDFYPVLTTYRLINEKYLESEKINKKELIKGAIDGMTEVIPEGLKEGFIKDKLRELNGQEITGDKLQPTEALKPAVEIYQRILDEISQKETLEKTEFVKGGMSGMLDVSGDDYSAVLTTEEYKELRRKKGKYVGLGMELERGKGPAKILDTYPDTPTSRSPIGPGDLILKIDGKPTDGMSFKEITEFLTGEKKTEVELTVKHQNGEREDVTLARKEIKIPPVEYELLPESGIALFDINTFTSETNRELKNYLEEMEERFLKPERPEDQDTEKEISELYGLLGNAHTEDENYKKALQYYNYARETLEKGRIKSSLLLARTYDNIGSIYQKKEEYDKAIKYHEKALETYRELESKENIETGKTYGNIGNAYSGKGNYEKAMESYRQAAKILEGGPESEKVFLAQVYSDLGVALENAERIEKAITRQEQAVKMFEEVSGSYPDALARIYNGLASAYREKGDVDKTMDYYQKRGEVKRMDSEKESRVNLNSYGNLTGHGTEGAKRRPLEDHKKEIMALQGFQGIIIDLRNNLGGSVDSTVSAMSEFIDSGIVGRSSNADGTMKKYESLGNEVPDFPLAVLINSETASAAELFAVTIKEREVGILVGRKSYGKQSVQTVFKIGNGFWVRLTTGKYYKPSGDNIPSDGLKPDLSSPKLQEDIPLAKEWILKN